MPHCWRFGAVPAAQAQDASRAGAAAGARRGSRTRRAAAPANAAVPQPEWEKVCGNVNKQQECHISRKRLAATGQAIAQFMIIERGDKKLLQIAVPPVALIQPGVQVKIDNGEATGVKYVVCTPGECLALGEINADFIGQAEARQQHRRHHAEPAGQAGELRHQPRRLHGDL